MTNMPQPDLGFDSDTAVDVRHTDGPVALVKVNTRIKTTPYGTTLSILTTEPEADKNLRSFCRSTNNEYLGCNHQEGYDVHWIKKTNAKMRCETCSNVRTVLSGVGTVAVLAYTSPSILLGGSSAITTILFILALAAVPPVAYNNLRLIAQVVKGKSDKVG